MQIITVMNQKGGVGKTATAINLLAGLKKRGYKVLAVDMDPQRGNMSQTILADKSYESMFEVLCKTTTLADVIQTTDVCDIAPATTDMSGIDAQLNANGGVGRERRLRDAIKSLPEGQYDFVVVDTPPALNLLTTNALCAADYVLVVTDPDSNALEGMIQLNDMIRTTIECYNPQLQYAGILMTKYKGQTTISKEMRSLSALMAEKRFSAKMFNTVIRDGVALPTSLANHRDVLSDAPKSNQAVDYENFTDELLSVIQKGKI